MRRARFAALVLGLLATLPASAQFRDIARGIETTSGMSRVHVPGLWLARLLTRTVRPEGVHDLRLAIFDSSSAQRPFDAAAIMRSSLDPSWQAIVRTTDHRSGEQAVIYAKPAGPKEISLMIFAIDAEESVLTELRVDADQLARYVSESADGASNAD